MDQIGKYEILDKIGSGGFAVVYKGYDPFIKRPVAIKVCYSRDTETRERFHREAEVAGRLEHRNVTRVYDFGIHEQMPYLVEEYLPGEDLAHMIRRGEPEDVATKINFMMQIAGGLEHAHSKGVIHRDIKPSNIRVLDDGKIKIMDFGTAKMTNVESNLTQTGMTLGTVAYLSPERLLGQDTGSAKSDIFSLGVLAYELFSFRRPFPGRSIPNLIDQVLNAAPVPLNESWPECPPSLADVVHRCLRKNPDERYSSCQELIGVLDSTRIEITSPTQIVNPDASVATGLTATGLTATGVDVQVEGLLERARQQMARGRLPRAELLLEEVLEINPSHAQAQELLDEVQERLSERGTGPIKAVRETDVSLSQTFTRENPADRRERKINEAANSVETYVRNRELGQAAAALKFAIQMLGEFDRAPVLREQIISTLRGDLVALKSAGVRQARLIAEQLTDLHMAQKLSLDLAEPLVSWIDELDSHHSAEVEAVVSQLRENDRDRRLASDEATRVRKQNEAVASIEKLLSEGNPEMAEKALRFAVRLLGNFDELPSLESRIAEAQRQGAARSPGS